MMQDLWNSTLHVLERKRFRPWRTPGCARFSINKTKLIASIEKQKPADCEGGTAVRYAHSPNDAGVTSHFPTLYYYLGVLSCCKRDGVSSRRSCCAAWICYCPSRSPWHQCLSFRQMAAVQPLCQHRFWSEAWPFWSWRHLKWTAPDGQNVTGN